MPHHENPPPATNAPICFGLDRRTDEASLIAFVERFARPDLLAILIPRLTDDEITTTLDFLTNLMKKRLSDPEYHRLFLAETP
jgi:hypothetical protein